MQEKIIKLTENNGYVIAYDVNVEHLLENFNYVSSQEIKSMNKHPQSVFLTDLISTALRGRTDDFERIDHDELLDALKKFNHVIFTNYLKKIEVLLFDNQLAFFEREVSIVDQAFDHYGITGIFVLDTKEGRTEINNKDHIDVYGKIRDLFAKRIATLKNEQANPLLKLKKPNQKLAWLLRTGVIDATARKFKEPDADDRRINTTEAARALQQDYPEINVDTIRLALDAIYKTNPSNKKNHPYNSKSNKKLINELEEYFQLPLTTFL